MAEHPYHQSLHLQNFTAFQDTAFKFVRGVNAFVGENGTGKTHVMKLLYAMQLALSREGTSVQEILNETFQTKNPAQLTRLGAGEDAVLQLTGRYGPYEWSYSIDDLLFRLSPFSTGLSPIISGKVERPVFIPAIDMMGHTRRFVEAYDEVRLDFDRTCRDIISLMGLERKNGRNAASFNGSLENLLGGKIERDEEARFYLVTPLGRLPMPLVAEGLRKIATLVQLQHNGWLVPGATLFWDEPEVNLNPVLMGEIVGAILALARQDVQVFVATHSYIILRELEVQSRKSDALCYFALSRTQDNDNIVVHPAKNYLDIDPNPIERQYANLYDRGIEKRLRGEVG